VTSISKNVGFTARIRMWRAYSTTLMDAGGNYVLGLQEGPVLVQPQGMVLGGLTVKGSASVIRKLQYGVSTGKAASSAQYGV
jgi:hypothetical protein